MVVSRKHTWHTVKEHRIVKNVQESEDTFFAAQWVSENGVEAPLPGFESYTPQQMFWVSYGQVFCSKYQDAALKVHIETASSPPERYRILGPLSNNKDFARDFLCPLGSRMNPEKRCKVW